MCNVNIFIALYVKYHEAELHKMCGSKDFKCEFKKQLHIRNPIVFITVQNVYVPMYPPCKNKYLYDHVYLFCHLLVIEYGYLKKFAKLFIKTEQPS